MAEFKKFPYRSEFPESRAQARSHQTLEDAIWWSRYALNARWHDSDDEEGVIAGERVYDAERALITNRNTGYRWLLRRNKYEIEFQTPQMFEDLVADQRIEPYLTVEEGEAVATVAKMAQVKDKRLKALSDQALEQIGTLCRQIRERVRAGDDFIDSWSRGIPHTNCCRSATDQQAPKEAPDEEAAAPRPPKENLSLKEAAEILGKARNTLLAWYRAGKFPPAVEIVDSWSKKPHIEVPRYRLEAWQAGARMPATPQQTFEFLELHEPPWICLAIRKGAAREDIEFWTERRSLTASFNKAGRRIYGEHLEPEKAYETFER